MQSGRYTKDPVASTKEEGDYTNFFWGLAITCQRCIKIVSPLLVLFPSVKCMHQYMSHQSPCTLLELTGLSKSGDLTLLSLIHPLSSERHRFILTAVEYFSKWAEAVAIRRQIGDCVAQFIKENIICRFGVPQKIITDNGLPFLGWRTAEMMEQFRIKKMEASPYTAQSKLNLWKRSLSRRWERLSENQYDWHERINDALWSYRTSTRLSTGVTPFLLVYGTQKILPLEIRNWVTFPQYCSRLSVGTSSGRVHRQQHSRFGDNWTEAYIKWQVTSIPWKDSKDQQPSHDALSIPTRNAGLIQYQVGSCKFT